MLSGTADRARGVFWLHMIFFGSAQYFVVWFCYCMGNNCAYYAHAFFLQTVGNPVCLFRIVYSIRKIHPEIVHKKKDYLCNYQQKNLFFQEKPYTHFRLSYEPDKKCNTVSGRHRKHSVLFNSNVEFSALGAGYVNGFFHPNANIQSKLSVF